MTLYVNSMETQSIFILFVVISSVPRTMPGQTLSKLLVVSPGIYSNLLNEILSSLPLINLVCP